MRSSRARVVAGALAWLALVACEGTGAPAVSPAQIGLQQGDLPGNLQRCGDSGDIGSYLRSPQPSGRPARDELQSAWRELQRAGAVKAAVTVYAAEPVACSARLGTGEGTNVASLVVAFRDDGAAADVYRHGVLGFATPSEDADVPGMARGAATGIGRNAWVLQRTVQGRALIVGLWERHAVLVLFVAVDADPLNAKRALSDVDGRIP